jgi:hypothetical protein
MRHRTHEAWGTARTGRQLVSACALAASVLFLLAAPASAEPRTEIGPITETFTDVNPCTGLAQTGTLVVTFYVQSRDGLTIAQADRTLSTSSGFFGAGTSSYVVNGQVEMFRFTDVLSNEAGDRIRGRSVVLADLTTGELRVDSFDLTCLGR